MRPEPAVGGGASRRGAWLPKPVSQVADATVESMHLEEYKITAPVDRPCGFAPAEDDWPVEQGHLVDEPGDERLRCDVRATDEKIPS